MRAVATSAERCTWWQRIFLRNVENAETYIRAIAEERETQLKELAGRRQVTHSWTLLNAARVTVVVPIERRMPSFL